MGTKTKATTTTIKELFPDWTPGKAEDVPDDTLVKWSQAADGHQRNGTKNALRVGRVLLYRREALKHGEAAAWTERTTTLLGKGETTIRLYMRVARFVEAESATPLPIFILDRPLRDLPRAIRNVKDGRAPDAVPPKNQSQGTVLASWQQARKRLLAGVERLPG